MTSSTAEHLIDGVAIYKFKVAASQFKKTGNDSLVFIMTILVQNTLDTEALYTIQYINYGKNVYLKEGDLKKDRISIDQKKYYLFTNTNEDVEEIRVHKMEISGKIFLSGYREDPRKANL